MHEKFSQGAVNPQFFFEKQGINLKRFGRCV